MSKTSKQQTDFIVPLNINGLAGRMMKLPAKKAKKREILLVYGHHSSLERLGGVAEYLCNFGNVTMPDLPGFGGMDSFYKIGKKAELDDFADYLASFIKLRYKNKRITIAGLSLGFVIATRMLQKYPELSKNINMLISLAGFAHKDDFKWKKRTGLLFWAAAWLLSKRAIAYLAATLLLRPSIIRLAYKLAEDKHGKLRDADRQERKTRVEFEVKLWRENDVRTYAKTSLFMFNLNLCNQHVALPVYHVAVEQDRYFDHLRVEQHMRSIFTDFHYFKPEGKFHGPTVIAKVNEIKQFVPPKLRKILNQEPN